MRDALMRGCVLCGLVVGVAGAQQVAAPGVSAGVSTMTTPSVNPVLTKPVEQVTPQEIAAMQKLLADWAQLGRYREENRKLPAAAAGERRVVFYGDSITDGWGRGRGKFFPDQPWINRGISGQTTPQMLVRFAQDVLGLKPEAVVILAGINDIAGNTGPETIEEIKANLRAMANLAKAAHVRVVLCSVLPAGRFPWHPGVDPREEVAALNHWLQGYAAQEGMVFLNYYPALVAADGGMRPEFAVDGVHPNDAGYAVMEPMARQAVAKALGGAPR